MCLFVGYRVCGDYGLHIPPLPPHPNQHISAKPHIPFALLPSATAAATAWPPQLHPLHCLMPGLLSYSRCYCPVEASGLGRLLMRLLSCPPTTAATATLQRSAAQALNAAAQPWPYLAPRPVRCCAAHPCSAAVVFATTLSATCCCCAALMSR